MRRSLAACFLLAALSAPPAFAAITATGDVSPSGIWTSYTEGYIGYTSVGTLTVNAGSDLVSDSAYLGYNAGATGAVSVDGRGSQWSNSYGLYAGYFGSGTLNITNGGAVNAAYDCWIGYGSGSTAAVTVDGAGSTWTTGNLFVGYSGSGTLNITNGGAVSVAGATVVAYNDGATGTINFGSGGTLTTGSVDASSIQLTGTATINARGLASDVDLLFDAAHPLVQTVVLHNSPNQNITINLDMASSPSTNGDLGAGWGGAGSLTIRDGIAVQSASGYIGYNSGAVGTATVDGAGSAWTASGSLYIGNRGNGTLNITNGGSVSVAGITYVGVDASSTAAVNFGASGGTLTTGTLFASPTQLTGTGTINTHGLISDLDLVFDATHGLTQTITLGGLPNQNVAINLALRGSSNPPGDLGAGWRGAGSLTIQDGVVVESANGYLGYVPGSNGTAVVAGPGSTWRGDNLYVGFGGSGQLGTSGGATCEANAAYLGYNRGATGTATVDGTGSTWNLVSLYVGENGAGTLSVTNGGSLSATSISIGDSAGGTGMVSVDGAGSTFSGTEICVGNSGSGTLNVTNGGTLNVTNGALTAYVQIGGNPGGTGTTIVDGAGSNLTSSYIWVANFGAGTLKITNGGTVTGPGGIGNGQGSTGTVIVNGTGSKWTASSLAVGSEGGGGTLTIANGGAVDTSSGYIGYAGGSPYAPGQTGAAAVDGTGSNLTDSGVLYVGYYTGNGTLSITNGGAANSAGGWIGDSGSGVTSGSGAVAVDGAGSNWTNSGALYLGYIFGASSATLKITNGGAVKDTLGYGEGACSVRVDGTGSTWTNSGDLNLSYYGSSDTLTIANGGTVSSTDANLGNEETGTVAIASISGAGAK